MKKRILLALILCATFFNVKTPAQEIKIPLYDGKIPNSIDIKGKERIQTGGEIVCIDSVMKPDIAVFLPGKKFATGQAVVICPGGGYWILAYDLEGTEIAKYLNSIGVAAIVLKYRLPVYGNTKVPHKAPLMDAQRAMRLVRFNAKNWNINPQKIGIMGFSAGGHLASTLGTHFDNGNADSPDLVERVSCRPDFMALIYPVITFTDPAMHIGSRNALLGQNPDKSLIESYSNELQVKDNTPPTFIATAGDDTAVPVQNSLLMYQALIKKNISAELHILSEGEHGFGLALKSEHVGQWTNSLRLWLNWLNTK